MTILLAVVVFTGAFSAPVVAQAIDTETTPALTDQTGGAIDTSAYETQREFDRAKAEEQAADRANAEAGAVVTNAAAADLEPELSGILKFQRGVDSVFEAANARVGRVLFFDVSFGLIKYTVTDRATGQPVLDANGAPTIGTTELPLIVIFLLLGGVFFTFRYGFVTMRLFGHSIQVIRGKYDDPRDHGEVSHFQALTAALSATVGLGNIAGVALAIQQGGAGAVFWMWVVAFFGMASKFSCCTLAQIYRRVEGQEVAKEHILGGPMVYLDQGMREVLGPGFGAAFGKTLAIIFAIFAIGGSLGGGNLFQGNQTYAIVGDVIFVESIANEGELKAAIGSENKELAAIAETKLRDARIVAADNAKLKRNQYAWIGGLAMTIMVGLVVVGGIRRIGEVTSKLVPAMCLFYSAVCLVIVFSNYTDIPAMFASIFEGAFTLKASAWGGIMGVLVIGVKRGAFSNEAGLGSAAIAHSAAKTSEPVREGAVAMIGPFIDTHVVCTMTALAILITKAHLEGSAGGFTNAGVGITASAFSTLGPLLPYLLMVAVFTFAYSTMISWCYYGERATEYLVGKGGIWPFRVVFLFCVFISPMISLTNLIDFTDLLLLSMAYPNILGMLFLSGKVSRVTKDYLRRLKSGEIKTYAELKRIEEGEPSI
jgi:AGCS family alanine or glycine:cation symporter